MKTEPYHFLIILNQFPVAYIIESTYENPPGKKYTSYFVENRGAFNFMGNREEAKEYATRYLARQDVKKWFGNRPHVKIIPS